jgi:hypothetical protein
VDASGIDSQWSESMKRFTTLWTLSAAVLLSVMAASPANAKKEQSNERFGVYVGGGCEGVKRLKSFGEWFGREPDYALEFISWEVLSKGTTWGVRCWSEGGKKNVVFSLPMLPKDKTATLADGAAGKFDDYFRRYAEHLVKHGFGRTVLRIGWEFNADWYPWRAQDDPQAWIAYWRRIVTTMRSVPGAEFKFDWNAAGGWTSFDPELAYPGDEYVDIIGLDFYNSLKEDVSPEERWAIRKKAPRGLDWHKRFATARSKPMSYPEWGTGLRKDGRGGDDDPYFIEQMAAWIHSNNVAYHMYWDYKAPDFDARLSDNRRPGAGTALKVAFASTGTKPAKETASP